ncbi:hypothetical protein ABIA39_008907 [Nocardia sp. GAS34]|uniref:hypothetical protein n=1 Tax=unclassified Nocardia TaxID=2637762 RepID=UPI003D253D0B
MALSSSAGDSGQRAWEQKLFDTAIVKTIVEMDSRNGIPSSLVRHESQTTQGRRNTLVRKRCQTNTHAAAHSAQMLPHSRTTLSKPRQKPLKEGGSTDRPLDTIQLRLCKYLDEFKAARAAEGKCRGKPAAPQALAK